MIIRIYIYDPLTDEQIEQVKQAMIDVGISAETITVEKMLEDKDEGMWPEYEDDSDMEIKT